MKIWKNCIKYISAFIIAEAVLLGLLVLSAMIPRSAIKQNVRESAEYLCEKEVFYEIVEDVDSSKIDRYADSILLGIAYQYDSDKPLTSVMWSSYYNDRWRNENENLLHAVTNDCDANQQYMRYWHGSNAMVRPLLTFLNIKQIYILNGIIMAVLIIGLLIILIKNKLYVAAVGISLGLILTSFWFVPFSLEYFWTYFIMLLMSIIGTMLILKKKYNVLGVFFLISGIVTNYFDFLTTETLTLTIPLLLMICAEQKQNPDMSAKTAAKSAVKAALFWLAGYACMWVAKWLLASLVFSENVLPYVSEHIEERLGGDLGIGFFQYIFGSVKNNIKCIFPFEYGIVGLFGGMILIILAIYTGYVYHGKNIDKKSVLLYLLIGLVPYIRYIVLHNHSYLHFFFTYRAQAATVLAIVMILGKVTERRWHGHARVQKRKK